MPSKATIVTDKKPSKSLILKNNGQMPRSSSKNKKSSVVGTMLWIKIGKGKNKNENEKLDRDDEQQLMRSKSLCVCSFKNNNNKKLTP